MTKKIITSYAYAALLCMAVMMAGATAALASEVTGTLSSDTGSNSQNTGSLEGTVSSDSQNTGKLEGTVSSVSGGSSSGGSRSSGSLSNAPSGSVLGESTSLTSTPGFPNAGFAPEEVQTRVTLWSTIVTFLRNIVSF